MAIEVEAGAECVAGHLILVHRDDVLKTEALGPFGAELEGLGGLAAVDAVEQVAVVDQEAWTDAPLAAELHEHHVEAEDLHLADTLAASIGAPCCGSVFRRRVDDGASRGP